MLRSAGVIETGVMLADAIESFSIAILVIAITDKNVNKVTNAQTSVA